MFENKSLKYNTDILTFDNLEVAWPEQIQIGDQIWTTQNLAIDDGGEGIYPQTVTYYGGRSQTEYYYTWPAAMRIASNISGWHLPTRAEFNALRSYTKSVYDSYYLESLVNKYGWMSLKEKYNSYYNLVGFGALASGYYIPADLEIALFSQQARFWTSEKYIGNTDTTSYAVLIWRDYSDSELYYDSVYHVHRTKHALSVRLIKDA